MIYTIAGIWTSRTCELKMLAGHGKLIRFRNGCIPLVFGSDGLTSVASIACQVYMLLLQSLFALLSSLLFQKALRYCDLCGSVVISIFVSAIQHSFSHFCI